LSTWLLNGKIALAGARLTMRISRTPRFRLRSIDQSSPEEVMADYLKLIQEHSALQIQHKALRGEYEALKRKTIAYLGERYILELTSGSPQPYAAPYDVLSASHHRLEVKSSSCRSGKWTWGNLLGSKGKRRYDYAILLGEKDSECFNAYPSDPYIIFCLPRNRLGTLVFSDGSLGCASRLKSGAITSEMRDRYMVSSDWITENFGDYAKVGINPVAPYR
jgi:hypothetical protein